jgi:iron(III) transport system substrate-binding protein
MFFKMLLLSIVWSGGLSLLPHISFSASAQPAEEIWKSLEKLPPAEREKKLIEGAKREGEMLWYTNSGIENAIRYIQAFKKNYPFINAQVWRAKTRQVTQRVISEANAGRNLVDVVNRRISCPRCWRKT